MQHILGASTSTVEVHNPPKSPLTKTQTLIFATLEAIASKVAEHRGYSPKVGQVTFHCPAEIVAFSLGIHRSTLYRNLPVLREAGLIDQRGHKTTLNTKTRCDGSLWAVKLNTESDKPARITHEEMKHQWRSLAHDIEIGRTAYAKMRQSNTDKGKQVDIDLILEFALSPSSPKTPLSMTVAPQLESLLDVSSADPEDRADMVNKAAQGVASAFGDYASLNFYRWLLWQLLRLLKHQEKDYFYQVYLMIQRAKVDKQEGFAKSAGALFVSRLKQSQFWDELRSVPMQRICPNTN